MLICTTENPGNFKIIESKGLVTGGIVTSKNFVKDFGAGLKTLVGGELKSYTKMLDEARVIAINRMIENAEKVGANAIVSMRMASSAIAAGAAEIVAYGTAVVIE